MASSSADIGANFSDYQGNPNLGSVGLGVFDIDTKPLQQLASYTFFYKKNLWEQKQRETDAKVAQLADLSNISLNDLRGKDKEQMVKEFAELQTYAGEFARKTPTTAQEKMQDQLEWQTKFGAFKNNYGSGKTRAVTYYKLRNEALTNIPDAKTQDEVIRQLDKRFEETDISTPISAVPNFKIEKFDIPKPIPQEFTSLAILGNDTIKIKNSIYNPAKMAPIADAFLLDINRAYPKKGTPEYEMLSPNEKNQADIQATVTGSGKGWIDAVGFLNKAMEKYVQDGKFDATDAESFETENASNTTLMKAYNAVKRYDAYSRNKYNEAKNGNFNDKGVLIPLGGQVDANDFKVGFVDFVKGVTANNLGQAGSFAEWQGDKFEKEVQHTGEANDLRKANIAAQTQRRGQDLDYQGKIFDLIGKGWTRDKKGKMQPPKNNPLTSTANGGIVPYWQNYITPQIEAGAKRLSIVTGINADRLKTFNGDVEISPNDISGLGIALFGEPGASGHTKAIIGQDIVEEDDRGNKTVITPATKVKLRFENGNPIGVVIDGVFYDQNDINSKATRLQDKTMTNKQDSNIFDSTKPTVDEYGVPIQ